MQLYKVGQQCIEIGDQLVPAVNILVEDVPGFIEMDNGESIWFGVYFQISFEDGSLWVVEHGTDGPDVQNDIIVVSEWYTWGMTQEYVLDPPDYGYIFQDWQSFLDEYNKKRLHRERPYIFCD